jgi:hypothetical protein
MTHGAGSRGTGFACEAQRATVSVTSPIAETPSGFTAPYT